MTSPAGPARPEKFPRTAIPVFMDRVSPVLDTCTRLRILEPDRPGKAGRRMVRMRGNTLIERAEEIKKLDVSVIICAVVSNPLYNLLRERYVDVVCGVTGEIEDVVRAYRNGSLKHSRFRMPGVE